MERFKDGLEDAWADVATFVPKLIGFLLILVIGYVIAKAIARILDRVLERVGFDKAVERGGVRQALARTKFDASDILTKLLFWLLFLFVLQLAFGVFGENPISDLLTKVIAYLPKIFVAIVIIIVGAAIAAGVKEIVEAALGGLDYGRALAFAASIAIIVLAIFAALDTLDIAPYITQGLFTAILVVIAGSAVVAIGGGGIQTMSRYWERAAQRVERESDKVKNEAEGAKDRIQARAQERAQQLDPNAPTGRLGGTSGGGTTSGGPPSGGARPGTT